MKIDRRPTKKRPRSPRRSRGRWQQFVSSFTLLCFTTATLLPGYVWAAVRQEPAVRAKDELRPEDVQLEDKAPAAVSVREESKRAEPAGEPLSDASKQELKAGAADKQPVKGVATAASDEPAETLDLPTGADKSGVSPQTVALPTGGASKLGMGESFSAQAATGTATFSVPFLLLPARGAAQPSLGLSYSSSSGAGLAGVGWSTGAPYIARQTDRGTPGYDDRSDWHPQQDRFIFNGGQELIPICTVGAGLACAGKLTDEAMPPWSVGHQYFRARVEGAFQRFFWSPDHYTWRVQDKSGVTLELGMPLDGSKSSSAIEANPQNPAQIYRWHLVRQYDTYGAANPIAGNPTPNNVVVYKYSQDANEGHAYLTDIYDTTPAAAPTVTTTTRYAHHTRLIWETRTDPSESYRSGWRVLQTRRLKRVDVASKTYTNGDSSVRRMVRRYHLRYDPAFHASLLTGVVMEGRCGATEAAAPAEAAESLPELTNCERLPELELSYGHVSGFSSAGQAKAADLATFEAFDERVQQMGGDPPHSVDEDQADFFDIDADGLPDVLATQPGVYGGGFGAFFNSKNGVRNSFGSATSMPVGGVSGENAGSVELRDANVLPLDLNGDGIVDLLHLESGDASYSTYSPKLVGGAWQWVGRRIVPTSGRNPKLTFGDGGLFAGETRTSDVNGDGLVDVVLTTGTELQTFLSLGRLPNGEAQFGSGAWTSATTSTLSNDPIKACLPALGAGSPVKFSSAEYQFAEMNGDGLPDIVHVYHGEIRYWPGRGNGFWGTGDRTDCVAGTFNTRFREMTNDEAIPGGTLRLEDMNGDGLDDLVRLRFDGVDIWLNVDGVAWTERHGIEGTPANPGFGNRVRITDVNGSGTRDIIWGAADRYQYIDLSGGARPQLLVGVKNGLGQSRAIEYTTSAQEMLSAEATGVACDAARKPWTSAWCSKMPTVVPVVKRVVESDNLSVGGSGIGSYVTEFSYRDPVYEGRQREFRGFSKARVRHIGDANSPTDNSDTTFLAGECEDETVANGVEDCALSERWRDNPREALKGLPVLTERYDDTGRYLSTEATNYRLRQLYVGRDGRAVRHAFEVRSRTTLYDTSAATTSTANDASPAIVELESAPPSSIVDLTTIECKLDSLPAPAVTTTRSQAVPLRATTGYATMESSYIADAYGNRLIGVRRGCVAGTACPTTQVGMEPDEVICSFSTASHAPSDPTGWLFRSDLSWVQGSVHKEVRNKTATSYTTEGAPLRTEAWLSGSVPLARSSSDPSLTPAGPPPNVSQDNSYLLLSERSYDALGNLVQERRPNGRCRAIKYEAALGTLSYAQLPSRELLYRDGCPTTVGDEPSSALVSIGTYDRGFNAFDSVTDFSVQRSVMTFDGFGRLATITKPLPTGEPITGSTLPTQKYTYDLPLPGSGRAYSVVKTEFQDGADANSSEYAATYTFVDGLGRARLNLLEADPTDDRHAWIVTAHVVFDAKNAIKRKYVPYFNDSSPLAMPIADTAPVAPTMPTGSATAVASATQRYDAFGRVLQAFDLDGTLTLQKKYHALSTDIYDAADASTGVHQGTFATSQEDGHGRVVADIERIRIGSSLESRDTRSQYLATGEPEVITRLRGSDRVTRWVRYDSLGRMVLNVDPHATTGFSDDPSTNESSLKTWRYAYDDAGDVVATTDARGCGVNFYYDNLGRLRAEDYSPCESGHSPVLPVSLSTGAGFDVVYEYDEASGTPLVPPPTGYAQDPLFLRGKPRAVHDRGSTTLFQYDARGRTTRIYKKLATIDAGQGPIANRYVERWYEKGFTFDADDRLKTQSTGASSNGSLLANDGTSQVEVEYSRRGTANKVTSSYGDLIKNMTRAADGVATDVVFGDAASTTTHSDFDARRRLSGIQTYRSAAPLWSTLPAQVNPVPSSNPNDPTRQLLLQDEDYVYDEVSNVTEVRDYRVADDWPVGAKPVSRKMQYDDLYRLSRVDYEYSGGGADSFVSPYSPEIDGTTDPRRPRPPGHKLLGTRPAWQTFSYDWLGNTSSTDDDLHAFYDRSLGTVTNDTNGKPYQLIGAAQVAGTHNGTITNTSYDAAGNLTGMRLTRSTAACAATLSDCSATFSYGWDEAGRLVKAARSDGSAPSSGSVTLRYAYDSGNDRVLKQASYGTSAPLTTAYVFDSLELRNAPYNGSTQQYAVDAGTEVVYLSAAGMRLAQLNLEQGKGEPQCSPTALHSANLHVVLLVPDRLGSTSIMLDRATGELVEFRTYQPYGAVESDYRPARWKGFRQDYGFSGKEEDVEVGLNYVGRRFYSPYLGRWISTDPLAIHSPGSADLNLYAYVNGRVLVLIDPLGLDPPKLPPPCVVPTPGQSNAEALAQEKAALEKWQRDQVDAAMAGQSTIDVPAPAGPRRPTFEQYWGCLQSVGEGNWVGIMMAPLGPQACIDMAPVSGLAGALGGMGMPKVSDGGQALPDLPTAPAGRSAPAPAPRGAQAEAPAPRANQGQPEDGAMCRGAVEIAPPPPAQPKAEAGRAANRIGGAREAKVAEMTGGAVSREDIRAPGLGKTDIDVVAPSGDLIMVGGPAKAKDLGNLGRVIKIYQHAAQERGVGVQAYFTSNTDAKVLKFAADRLGAGNVHTFQDVKK